MSTFINLVQNDLNKKNKKNEKSKIQSIQRGTKINRRTCKKKGYCYNQCRQRRCCSNNEYIKEANRQLSDKQNCKTYKKTKHFNTVIWFEGFKKENLLSKKLTEGLKSVNPKSPKFYISPKIHKENNPGIPAINSINCYTSEISRFVEHHLQPLVREIPSYIKDTNDSINKSNNFPVPSNL